MLCLDKPFVLFHDVSRSLRLAGWQLVVKGEAFAYEIIAILIRLNTILWYLKVEVYLARIIIKC